MSDWDTKRYEDAQAGIYSQVLSELHNGRKESHWMWFIFPQLRGLGQSRYSYHFGIPSIIEAERYMKHPILGQRVIECTNIMLSQKTDSADKILGQIDAVKFKSSMTLFSLTTLYTEFFNEALIKYYNGSSDRTTLKLLKV